MRKPQLYEVYQTDTELRFIELMHTGQCRDIAETIMLGLYEADERKVDYMIFDTIGHQPVGILVSEETTWGELSPL